MATRSNFIRYRRGNPSSAPTLAGFLTVYQRAAGPLPGHILAKLTSGQIDFGRGVNLERYDILRDKRDDRLYQVVQLAAAGGFLRAHVAEILPPIPDDFNCGTTIEEFWSDAGVGAWALEVDQAELTVSGAGLTSSDALGIPFLYQSVGYDFDVYARVKTSAGSGSVTRYVGIKAGNSGDTAAVFVGIKDDGSAVFVHQEWDGVTDAEAEGGAYASAAYGYVRLRRFGCRLSAFWATTALPPAKELDWHEIYGANLWETHAALRVGVAAYCDGTLGSPDIRFKALRNWIAGVAPG